MSVFLQNLFLRTFAILGYSIKITTFVLGSSNYQMEEMVVYLLLPLLFLLDILITLYTQNNHNAGGHNQEVANLPYIDDNRGDNNDDNNEGPVKQAIDNVNVNHANIPPAQDNNNEQQEVEGLADNYKDK